MNASKLEKFLFYLFVFCFFVPAFIALFIFVVVILDDLEIIYLSRSLHHSMIDSFKWIAFIQISPPIAIASFALRLTWRWNHYSQFKKWLLNSFLICFIIFAIFILFIALMYPLYESADFKGRRLIELLRYVATRVLLGWIGLQLVFILFAGLPLAFYLRKNPKAIWKIYEEIRLWWQQGCLKGALATAKNMLKSDVELVRIDGCHALMNLGIGKSYAKNECVHLLFDFINNPPLIDGEKDKSLDELFPSDKALRSDIQEAITSFSAIYKYYGEHHMLDEEVILPLYFWKNKKKGKISFIKADLQEADLREMNLQEVDLQNAYLDGAYLDKANLQGANLKGADLPWANLEKAKLQKANLRGANFYRAELQDADVSGADMRKAIDLTKEQILSAKWGYDSSGYGGPPQLPESLLQDDDIKKWLETPAYDER